jgi:hypothetical protein
LPTFTRNLMLICCSNCWLISIWTVVEKGLQTMTDVLTTASCESGQASTEGQLNTKEWGKLVWTVPPPSHAPLQAQSTDFLNRLCILYEITNILSVTLVNPLESAYLEVYM